MDILSLSPWMTIRTLRIFIATCLHGRYIFYAIFSDIGLGNLKPHMQALKRSFSTEVLLMMQIFLLRPCIAWAAFLHAITRPTSKSPDKSLQNLGPQLCLSI